MSEVPLSACLGDLQSSATQFLLMRVWWKAADYAEVRKRFR